MHGSVLLGYLPVGKFDAFTDKTRSLARYEAFHSCLRVMLDSLVEAGKSGVLMTCADRRTREIYPILAAYVADYPEQCLAAGCVENRCPTGTVPPNKRGSHEHCTTRDKNEILSLLDAHRDGILTDDQKARFQALGLRPIHEPFWRDLPHTSVFECFTPDLLHQLHKGVFKDHLVKWCTTIIGVTEMDARFRDAPTLHNLRHFKSGISHVSQWTGHEHKEMEKIFVPLMAGAVDDEVLLAIRALLDFIYLASLQSQTTSTLAALRQALDDFHVHKDAFIQFNARQPAHFNIPKYHMLEHYYDLILMYGSADGFNTEWSERLHIDYAKDAYRASNKKDYIAQMTAWLTRQESVDRFQLYLQWLREGEYKLPEKVHLQELERELIQDSAKDSGSIIRTTAEPISQSQRSALTLAISGPQSRKRKRADKPKKKPTPSRTPAAIAYQVAANHPEWLRNIPASTLVEEHRATWFIPALSAYIHSLGSPFSVYPHDTFDLFKQLVVHLPSIPEVSSKPEKLKNIIQVTPPIYPSGRRLGEPAHLDFALIHTGEPNADTDGTPLQGKLCRLLTVLLLTACCI